MKRTWSPIKLSWLTNIVLDNSKGNIWPIELIMGYAIWKRYIAACADRLAIITIKNRHPPPAQCNFDRFQGAEVILSPDVKPSTIIVVKNDESTVSLDAAEAP